MKRILFLALFIFSVVFSYGEKGSWTNNPNESYHQISFYPLGFFVDELKFNYEYESGKQFETQHYIAYIHQNPLLENFFQKNENFYNKSQAIKYGSFGFLIGSALKYNFHMDGGDRSQPATLSFEENFIFRNFNTQPVLKNNRFTDSPQKEVLGQKRMAFHTRLRMEKEKKLGEIYYMEYFASFGVKLIYTNTTEYGIDDTSKTKVTKDFRPSPTFNLGINLGIDLKPGNLGKVF